ncbi:MAG: hypothetical protein H6575_09290 [Lewinellaceae bacterium]|nr:hypothetical protein [Lewinellaceae bacterium]
MTMIDIINKNRAYQLFIIISLLLAIYNCKSKTRKDSNAHCANCNCFNEALLFSNINWDTLFRTDSYDEIFNDIFLEPSLYSICRDEHLEVIRIIKNTPFDDSYIYRIFMNDSIKIPIYVRKVSKGQQFTLFKVFETQNRHIEYSYSSGTATLDVWDELKNIISKIPPGKDAKMLDGSVWTFEVVQNGMHKAFSTTSFEDDNVKSALENIDAIVISHR